jgi:hypothetical protein
MLSGLVLALCLTCTSVSAAGNDLDQSIAKATLVKVGQAAPDFTCTTIDGRTFRLSDLKGKVVVLSNTEWVKASASACLSLDSVAWIRFLRFVDFRSQCT